VSVAIPAEGPALVSVVLATVDEVLGPAAYELRLRRQAEPAPAVPSSRATRPVGELSWI
jgi:hypothetical protein